MKTQEAYRPPAWQFWASSKKGQSADRQTDRQTKDITSRRTSYAGGNKNINDKNSTVQSVSSAQHRDKEEFKIGGYQWWVQRGGAQRRAPPPSVFLHFHTFFGKYWAKQYVSSPTFGAGVPWEILDLPLDIFLPPATEGWGKVMFLVCSHRGGVHPKVGTSSQGRYQPARPGRVYPKVDTSPAKLGTPR